MSDCLHLCTDCSKFLVDRWGHVVQRYSSDISESAMMHDVYNQLIRDDVAAQS